GLDHRVEVHRGGVGDPELEIAVLGAPPVEDQDEVAELLLGREDARGRGALENPVVGLPALAAGPAAKVESRIERVEALVLFRDLVGRRIGRRQLLDADVSEVTGGALGLEAEVALARVALRSARDLPAV